MTEGFYGKPYLSDHHGEICDDSGELNECQVIDGIRALEAENTRLRAENTALKAAATGDAWLIPEQMRLLDIANTEIVNLKEEIEERDRDYTHLNGVLSRQVEILNTRDAELFDALAEIARLRAEHKAATQEVCCKSCGGIFRGDRDDATCRGCGLVVCQSCCDVFGHIENERHGQGDPAEEVRRLRAELVEAKQSLSCVLALWLKNDNPTLQDAIDAAMAEGES